MNSVSRETELLALQNGLMELDLALTIEQQNALLSYLDLLERWTGVYNLTAVRARSEMLITHLFDCLAVVRPVRQHFERFGGKENASILDVGSGAGLPGVVLAICLPNLSVTCIDTVAKKSAFIQQVALQLRLRNLKSVHGRVEKHASQYDVVCSRAFASLDDFVTWTRNCLTSEGVWLAMKGKSPEEELKALTAVNVLSTEVLQVPGLHAERRLLWLTPSKNSER